MEALMDKPCRKPDRANAEETTRIICMVINEVIKLVLALRGGR